MGFEINKYKNEFELSILN